MSAQKPLSLLDRFEPSECRTTHPSLTYPVRFMRLLGPIVDILRSVMKNIKHQVSMSNTITSQFVCHDLSGLAAMTAQ
jgi:hypothetical protein